MSDSSSSDSETEAERRERKAQKKAQKESKKRRRADEEEAQEAPTDFNAEPSAPPKMQRVESDCLLRAPKEDEEYVLIRVPAEVVPHDS